MPSVTPKVTYRVSPHKAFWLPIRKTQESRGSQSALICFGPCRHPLPQSAPLAYFLRDTDQEWQIITIISAYSLTCIYWGEFPKWFHVFYLIWAPCEAGRACIIPFSEKNWGLTIFTNIPFPQQWETDQVLITSSSISLDTFVTRGKAGYIYLFIISVYLQISGNGRGI